MTKQTGSDVTATITPTKNKRSYTAGIALVISIVALVTSLIQWWVTDRRNRDLETEVRRTEIRRMISDVRKRIELQVPGKEETQAHVRNLTGGHEKNIEQWERAIASMKDGPEKESVRQLLRGQMAFHKRHIEAWIDSGVELERKKKGLLAQVDGWRAKLAKGGGPSDPVEMERLLASQEETVNGIIADLDELKASWPPTTMPAYEVSDD